MPASFEEMWRELAAIGRDPDTGGYHRYGWSKPEREAEAWFLDQCHTRGLEVESDSIGNLVAWWAPAGIQAGVPGVLTGSHLDSVPDGGAYDGPLGVVSALAAVDALRTRGAVPVRPIGVSVFVEEEGSRFGMPCLGSRLATGVLDPERALALRDRQGVSLLEALDRLGDVDPDRFGSSDIPSRAAAFVELHVEQGRALAEGTAPVGVGTAIWPHGRYRLDITGRADHAGATRMEDRADPMLTYATAVLAASEQARLLGARATFGRVQVHPNSTNGIASHVTGWLDARAADDLTVEALVEAIGRDAGDRAKQDGTEVTLTPESVTAVVDFDESLRDRVAAAVASRVGEAPLLPTAAGHDAGVLSSAGVPTAMLFVRNPTGVSHSPDEYATPDDCLAGVEALAAVLEDLACRSL